MDSCTSISSGLRFASDDGAASDDESAISRLAAVLLRWSAAPFRRMKRVFGSLLQVEGARRAMPPSKTGGKGRSSGTRGGAVHVLPHPYLKFLGLCRSARSRRPR
jgi:hypothetical protein